MIMMPDKKKMAMMIIKKKFEGPSGESHSEVMEQKDGPMEDNEIGYEVAAEKMISAMEKKDAKMLKSCLKDFIEMCMHEDKDEDDGMEYDL